MRKIAIKIANNLIQKALEKLEHQDHKHIPYESIIIEIIDNHMADFRVEESTNNGSLRKKEANRLKRRVMEVIQKHQITLRDGFDLDNTSDSTKIACIGLSIFTELKFYLQCKISRMPRLSKRNEYTLRPIDINRSEVIENIILSAFAKVNTPNFDCYKELVNLYNILDGNRLHPLEPENIVQENPLSQPLPATLKPVFSGAAINTRSKKLMYVAGSSGLISIVGLFAIYKFASNTVPIPEISIDIVFKK